MHTHAHTRTHTHFKPVAPSTGLAQELCRQPSTSFSAALQPTSEESRSFGSLFMNRQGKSGNSTCFSWDRVSYMKEGAPSPPHPQIRRMTGDRCTVSRTVKVLMESTQNTQILDVARWVLLNQYCFFFLFFLSKFQVVTIQSSWSQPLGVLMFPARTQKIQSGTT
jgi:hypothetical protein